ncbi:MAG TPA: hypothetical protein PKD84_04500 [Propionicimonas sp.]|nr:hypothetical protein [Propionicimonas sp.]
MSQPALSDDAGDFNLPDAIAEALPHWTQEAREELAERIHLEARQACPAGFTHATEKRLLELFVHRCENPVASEPSIPLSLVEKMRQSLPTLPDDILGRIAPLVAAQLQELAGEALTEGVSDASLEEFEKISDHEMEFVTGWLEFHVPDFRDRADFGIAMPASEDPDLVLAEYAAKCWLEVNRPDYSMVVELCVDRIMSVISDVVAQVGDAALVTWARMESGAVPWVFESLESAQLNQSRLATAIEAEGFQEWATWASTRRLFESVPLRVRAPRR